MADCEALRLHTLRSLNVLDTPANAAIERLTQLAAKIFDTPIALVSLIDEDRQWIKARHGLDVSQTPRAEAFCARTIKATADPVMVVDDARLDPRFAANPAVTGAPDVRFYAGAPLTTKDGHNLGALCVIDNKPRPRPDDMLLEQLVLLASIVVDEFELARADRQSHEQQHLLEAAEAMAGIGHWRVDLLTDTVFWSDAIYAIHGVERGQFDPNLNDTIAFFHQEDQETVRTHLAAAMRDGEGFALRLRLIRGDGALRHVSSRAVCERDEKTGRVVAIVGVLQDVTETVEAINALRRREERYRLVTEHAADVITLFDFSGARKFTSPAIEHLLGYRAEDVQPRTIFDLMHPDDREAATVVFREMSQGLDQRTIQHRSLHRRGDFIWVESNLQLVRDDDGAPAEVVCISRDISDRKALEFELIAARDDAREQAQRALLAEEIAGLGHWRYDLKTKRLEVSAKMFEIYGLPVVERPSLTTFLDAIHPDEQAAHQARIAERLRTGQAAHNVQNRIVRPTGQERWVSGSSIIVSDGQGDPAFMGTVRDITDERAAQLALSHSEARYRQLADNASDIIASFDPAGAIVFISPACQAVLGYAPEELVGRRVTDLTHPEDRGRMIAHYADLARQGPEASAPPYQFRALHKEGRWVWLEGRPKLFFDGAGGLASIQDVARDISARKATEEALIEAKIQAEAAAAAKSDFLSNMSHELRTPLTAVLGYARLLHGQPELSGTTRHYVERIASAGESLMSTINDVLDFSKLEAGQVEIATRACDPRALFQEVIDLFAAQAQQKSIVLDLRIADTLPQALRLAPERMRQVMLNLVGNAVKFTDAGAVSIAVAWDWPAERLRVEIRDTGPGIPEDRVDRLFQRFSQIDGSSTRRHGGSGLGLAICKGLVETMGGRIGVESTPGQGAMFWFDLPAQAVATASPRNEAPCQACLPEACRVLIVDDNAVNRELVSTMLEICGAQATQAADGPTAVSLADTQPFDVILMDLRMPGMDGRAATELIRRGHINGNVPVIAFSADVSPVLEPMFDGALAKPLEPTSLIREIARVLDLTETGHAA